jgi:hypothetical protein
MQEWKEAARIAKQGKGKGRAVHFTQNQRFYLGVLLLPLVAGFVESITLEGEC